MTQEQLDAYNARQCAKKLPSVIKDDADSGKESELLKKISTYFNEHGIYFFHDRSAGKNKGGHPDITACLPEGRVVFIELKSKTGRLSDEQKLVKLKLLGTGHEFYECRSFKRFLEICESI